MKPLVSLRRRRHTPFAWRATKQRARRPFTRIASSSPPIRLSWSLTQILGKPAGAADATRMLQLLSGAEHVVQTAVVVRAGGREWSDLTSTRVRFCPLTPEEIAWYVGTGEPAGKAGAYAIQGHAARFVNWIEGSWSNVVGLPVATVYRMLKEAGSRDILRATPHPEQLGP